jgi:hypothetical protein
LNRKITLLDRCISPRCLHQLGFSHLPARRANERYKKPQALAAHGYWTAFAKELSALGIKDEWAKGKLGRHGNSVERFAGFRNFSAPDLGLFGMPERILRDTLRVCVSIKGALAMFSKASLPCDLDQDWYEQHWLRDTSDLTRPQIRRRTNGSIDIDFYRGCAKRERDLAIKQAGFALLAVLVRLLQRARPTTNIIRKIALESHQ